jgi:hypothetical protein
MLDLFSIECCAIFIAVSQTLGLLKAHFYFRTIYSNCLIISSNLEYKHKVQDSSQRQKICPIIFIFVATLAAQLT